MSTFNPLSFFSENHTSFVYYSTLFKSALLAWCNLYLGVMIRDFINIIQFQQTTTSTGAQVQFC